MAIHYFPFTHEHIDTLEVHKMLGRESVGVWECVMCVCGCGKMGNMRIECAAIIQIVARFREIALFFIVCTWRLMYVPPVCIPFNHSTLSSCCSIDISQVKIYMCINMCASESWLHIYAYMHTFSTSSSSFSFKNSSLSVIINAFFACCYCRCCYYRSTAYTLLSCHMNVFICVNTY